MNQGKRLLKTSIGGIGEELTEFPSNYIQPSQEDKRKIQSGYLDLLYYEYREQIAMRDDMMCSIFLVIAACELIFHSYTSILFMIFAGLGAVIMVKNRGVRRKFGQYRRAIAEQLLIVGVGVEDNQLEHGTISSTAWGKLGQWAVSDLGIVRPVSKKGIAEDALYVFNVLEDKVYR